MLEGARMQTTPGDRPAGRPAPNDRPDASWPRRAAGRVDELRERALSLALRAPGYEHAIGTLRHDRQHGGGLLAGALAFRLFGALLPLALLATVSLGYASTVDRNAPGDAGNALGIGPAVLDSVATSSRLSTGTRWTVVAFGVMALLWSAMSAARAIRAVHSLAWEGGVGRFARPVHAAVMLLLAVVAFGAVVAGASKARADLGGLAGLVITLVAFVGFFGIWLGLSWLLPHRRAPLRALVPGALLVALGVEVIHLGTVLFIGQKLERASQTYGTLGVAFTILFWLFVVSRVIVASAMLNATLDERASDASREVVA